MASGMNFRCLQALQFQRLVHLFLAGVSSHYNEAGRYLKLNMRRKASTNVFHQFPWVYFENAYLTIDRMKLCAMPD
jgi:hypothetical protein